MLFAHLKRILRLDRLRLRGPCGARDDFLAELFELGAPERSARYYASSRPEFFNRIDPKRIS